MSIDIVSNTSSATKTSISEYWLLRTEFKMHKAPTKHVECVHCSFSILWHFVFKLKGQLSPLFIGGTHISIWELNWALGVSGSYPIPTYLLISKSKLGSTWRTKGGCLNYQFILEMSCLFQSLQNYLVWILHWWHRIMQSNWQINNNILGNLSWCTSV